jgi:hypothetical protein
MIERRETETYLSRFVMFEIADSEFSEETRIELAGNRVIPVEFF